MAAVYLPHQKLVRRSQISSPRICDLGGLSHASPVAIEVVLGCGQIAVSGE